MYADLSTFMELALMEAAKAFEEGEVPVGAVVASKEGDILGVAHNRPISSYDPTAHAEILAIRNASAKIGNYRLTDCSLITTIEPCIMCMGAAFHARIETLVFGAKDPKGGAAGSLYNLAEDSRLNHKIHVVSGILEKECGDIIRSFFQKRRGTEEAVTGATRNRLVG